MFKIRLSRVRKLKICPIKSIRFFIHCTAFETRKPNQSCLQLFFSYFQVARWSGTFGRFDQRFRRKDGKQKATGSRDRSLWSQNPYEVAFWFHKIFLGQAGPSPYLSASALDFLQFSSLKYPVWWTWFLVYLFQTWILQVTAGRKI